MEKITNQQRKQNETARNIVWAAPVIVIYYHSLSTAQQEFQKITAGNFEKHMEQDFTSLEPDHQG